MNQYPTVEFWKKVISAWSIDKIAEQIQKVLFGNTYSKDGYTKEFIDAIIAIAQEKAYITNHITD